MKKIICLLLSLLLLAACSTALGETDLQALIDANVIGVMHDTYPSTAQHIAYYDPETGEVTDSFISYGIMNPDTGMTYAFAYPNGDMEMYGAGEGYAYDGETRLPTVLGFLGSVYEEIMTEFYGQNLGEFFDGQAITAEETTANGKLLITTEGVIPADFSPFGELYAGATLVVRYTVDPDNLIIEASDVYIRGEDGADKLVCNTVIELDPAFEPPFDVVALKNPEKTREIHIILNPGTDEEFDHVFIAPLDVLMSFYVPTGYELYLDEACTTLTTGVQPDENGHYPETMTRYCAPEAK